jgi:hypothetical protein
MTVTDELAFSGPELTFLAIKLGREYFPATPLPDLDVESWKTVERGLMARGVVRGRFRLTVDDDVADVLNAVLYADRSLWTKLSFAEGRGQTHGQVLWLRDDAVVRQRGLPDGSAALAVCSPGAIDEMLAEFVEFPDAADSQAGAPMSLPMADFHEALYTAAEESPAAASTRYPATAGYLAAFEAGRSSRFVEHCTAGPGPDRREKLTFVESRTHGLWLAHDDPHPDGDLDGVMTRVQQVTVAMAREEATALVHGGAG